jgi:ubiquitin-protein ligase
VDGSGRLSDGGLQTLQNPINCAKVYRQGTASLKRVFPEGPAGIPSGGHIWPLAIIFGDKYPVDPSLLRFSVIPSHMNVSSDGIVCLDFVTTNLPERCRYLGFCP